MGRRKGSKNKKPSTKVSVSIPQEKAYRHCPSCNAVIILEHGTVGQVACRHCENGFVNVIGAQEGPQTMFLSLSDVDIVVYGGAAGGGKSFALLLEPLRNINDGRFRATTFRRTSPEITKAGGLWDVSMEIYPTCSAKPRASSSEWIFPSGAKHSFLHFEHETDKGKHLGLQSDLLQFDQLETFTHGMFFFLVSRVRGTGAVESTRIRATLNPPDPNEPEGMWVHQLLAPWVDPEHERYPMKAGEILHLYRDEEAEGDESDFKWYDEPQYETREGRTFVKTMSFSFVPATIFDNKILLDRDPRYMSKLNGLQYEERLRLRDGRWDILKTGTMFKRPWLTNNIININSLPKNLKLIRVWDKAATDEQMSVSKTPYTCGLKVGYLKGEYYILGEVHERMGTTELLETMRSTAIMDGHQCAIYEEREPSASGKIICELQARTTFAGFTYDWLVPGDVGDKIKRANPASAAAEKGLIHIVATGDPVADRWIKPFITEVTMFPNGLKDRVDCLAWAVLILGGSYKRISAHEDREQTIGRRRWADDYESNQRSNSTDRFLTLVGKKKAG